MFTLLLLLFLPAADATCPTILPTDASFGAAGQYHGGEYGTVSSVHLLSFANPAPSTYSLAYNLASGVFMKSPSTQCPASCLTRLRALNKPSKDENSNSFIMMWDDASKSPPATNLLYAAYTNTVLPGEYLYCSSVAGTCGASTPLYLYYNSETDDYQVRGDKDTVDDKSARLQNMGLPICWTFPPTPKTSTTTSTVSTTTTPSRSVSTTTTQNPIDGPSTLPMVVGGRSTSASSTTTSSRVAGGTSTTTTSDGRAVTGSTTTAYKGPSTTFNPFSTTTTSSKVAGGSSTTTTSDERVVTGSSTTTTAYTGPSTTINPSSSTTTSSSTTMFTGSVDSSNSSSSMTSSASKTTTTSPFVYNVTTDASGTFGPGDQKLENGTVIRPNGDTIYPNGTVKTADGTVIEGGKKIDPDGTVHNPDGSTKYPNGTVTYPSDSPTVGGGGTSDDDTPSWIIPVIIVTTILIGVGALGMIIFGVTSMMKQAPQSAVSPYERPIGKEQWPNQQHPRPSSSADLPPPVYEPVTTAQPQSFGATQSLAGAPNPLYFG